MSGTLKFGSRLPDFSNTGRQRKWVSRELDTARFIQRLWQTATSDRSNPRFLAFLIRCGWNNESHGRGSRSLTIKWRNHHLAHWLDMSDSSADALAADLSRRFRSLRKDASELIRTQTGITNCYGAVRAVTLDFLERNPGAVKSAFREVSSRRKPEQKLRKVMKLIDRRIVNRAGRKINLLNGITPTLACLDPAKRFPIVNAKTDKLLKQLHLQADCDGAVELSRLIGKHNIKNSFELDVYAATQFARWQRGRRAQGRSRPKD